MEFNSIAMVQVLEELGLTMDQFIDLCILCGCDYIGTIKGKSSLPVFFVAVTEMRSQIF